MSQLIHPTAIIDPSAELDPTVEVGPYAVIEAGVTIGAGTKIGPHVHIQGITKIGRDNFIGTGAVIGLPPQHAAYKGAPTRVEIGDNNTFREYVSIHRAYVDGAATVIGNRCYIMGYVHIGHDSKVGDGAIMANTAVLAGHAVLGAGSFVSGFSGLHQFCRAGRLAMIGGLAKVTQDVPPFVMIDGIPGRIRGLNKVGMKRAGVSEESIAELELIAKRLHDGGPETGATAAGIDLAPLGPEAREFVEFYLSENKRGVLPFFGVAQRDRFAD